MMMDSSLRMIRVMGVVGMVTILGALGGATRRAPVQARGILPRTACAALGAYQIGARIVPERAGTHPGVSSGTARPGRATTAIVSRPWLLRGTLTLSGYSGCGQPTAGTFSIQRSVVGPPIERPRGQGATMMCPLEGSCGFPVTGVISATGSFTQDAAHASDPLYVLVSATITTARPGPQQGRPCSTQTGCPPATVIMSTVTMTNVTGYLQATATDSQRVILSFLPPPTSASDAAPTPLVLDGRRGVQPIPTPQP